MNPDIQRTQEDKILQAIPELSRIKSDYQRRRFTADIARILENLKRKRF